MEDIVFTKKYRSRTSGMIVYFVGTNAFTVLDEGASNVHEVGKTYASKHSYRDTSVWEPVEEEHTVSEKEPFPAFEAIEYFCIKPPEWWVNWDLNVIPCGDDIIFVDNEKTTPSISQYELIKDIYENSKDFKVTWKLKENINRKLHKNKPLAMAIGRWLDENEKKWIRLSSGSELHAVSTLAKFFTIWVHPLDNASLVHEATLPDDYEIPEQVLQWMKEYEKDML